MLNMNYVVGQFENITTEQIIDLPPSSEKIIFGIDSSSLMVSINNNENYIRYNNTDGFITIDNNPGEDIYIDKLYVKSCFDGISGAIRVWALL